MAERAYKIVLVGDGQTGKTAYTHRVLGCWAEKQPGYIATMGVEVHAARLHLGERNVTLNLWDTAGQEQFGGLRDGYYVAADGALVFFNPSTHVYTLDHWITDLRRMVPNIPIVAVAHPVNSDYTDDHAKFDWDQSEYLGPRHGVLGTIGISTEKGLHILEPLELLVRQFH